ncbi:MAG: type II toxin-antitoxin system VapC family toxin [Candidatus Aminicenantes bacterium]|jgi:predicted nucleic acid-binding protein
MPIGVDTGFFFALEELHPIAVEIWKNKKIITCSIVLFEIQRKLLKGELSNWVSIIDDIERSVEIVSISPGVAKRASHISHGTGMPAIDSLILSAFLEANCQEIYTRDEDFELYKKKDLRIINLKKIKRL